MIKGSNRKSFQRVGILKNEVTMKKKLVYHLVLLLLLFGNTVFAQHSERNEKSKENSWIAAENMEGVKILCSTYHLNGQSYLAVSFQNLTNKTINGSWSMANGSKVIVSEADLNIKKLETKTVKNEKEPIPFSEGDSQAMVKFKITTK